MKGYKMDAQELFSCCRSGDLERVRFLVEQRDIDVNIRDHWDSTPLYYACLCGHIAVVEYLIGVGSRCKANTFDGERCLYGALTDEIRRTLKQHNLITAHTIRRNAFNEFLRRLYESGEESDITLVVNGREFHLHRCLLAARSSYFCHMLSSKWRHRKKIYTHKVDDHDAFDCVMRYVYTGRLECSFDLIDQCLTIALNCKLPKFKQHLDEALKRAELFQIEKQGRVQVTTLVIEPEDNALDGVQNDLRELAQSTLPPDLRVWPTEMPFLQQEMPALADVCFIVEGLSFMCHKIFFVPRSGYFKAIVTDHFNESQFNDDSEDSIPCFTMNQISAAVFAVIVSYLYCNQIDSMVTEETAVDVLSAAEMCLLPDLKRQCGVFLGGRITFSNVFDIHRLSRFFSLPRLEDQCVAFIAKNFMQLHKSELLQELILADAAEVEERQETDTVTIVDEIRFHLSCNLCNISDIEEAKEKLSQLEDLLEELEIEA